MSLELWDTLSSSSHAGASVNRSAPGPYFNAGSGRHRGRRGFRVPGLGLSPDHQPLAVEENRATHPGGLFRAFPVRPARAIWLVRSAGTVLDSAFSTRCLECFPGGPACLIFTGFSLVSGVEQLSQTSPLDIPAGPCQCTITNCIRLLREQVTGGQ